MSLSSLEPEKLRDIWFKFGSPFAERFVNNARGKGIGLNYDKDSLKSAEDFILESWKKGYMFPRSTDSQAEAYDKALLVIQSAAFLARIIIKDFGGELGFDDSLRQPCVENVGGLGIRVFTALRTQLLVGRGLRGLKQYYDRVAWAVREVGAGRIIIDKDRLWKIAEGHAYKLRSVDESTIRKTGDLNPVFFPFAYCPKCDDITSLVVMPVIGIRKEEFQEAALNTVFTMLEAPCDKCEGQTLLLGYSFNHLAWMIPRPKDGSMPDKPPSQHPDRREIFMTIVNTTLGRSVSIISEVHRSGNKVTGFGGTTASPVRGGVLFVPLPDTPLCF
ncbi:MAG: hypothetical protein N3F08_01645 [Crenarchaeota archaeon]|nr:hypothetical protein [Thermoproteota archaeon]